jgi:hypothetical protein
MFWKKSTKLEISRKFAGFLHMAGVGSQKYIRMFPNEKSYFICSKNY